MNKFIKILFLVIFYLVTFSIATLVYTTAVSACTVSHLSNVAVINISVGESTTISPGGYAIITGSNTEVEIPDGVSHLSTGNKKIGNGLTDDNDMVIIKNPDGIIIDRKEYS